VAGVPGAIAMIVALLVFPVLFLMGMAVVAGVLGEVLTRDGDARHEGSELVDLNV
jgi:high-affinity nickel permease